MGPIFGSANGWGEEGTRNYEELSGPIWGNVSGQTETWSEKEKVSAESLIASPHLPPL